MCFHDYIIKTCIRISEKHDVVFGDYNDLLSNSRWFSMALYNMETVFLNRMFSPTCNIVPSRFLLRVDLKGRWYPPIKSWSSIKFLSGLASDIMSMHYSSYELLPSKLIFWHPKTYLFKLLLLVSMRAALHLTWIQ